jgi:hypothetical protein
MLMLVKIFVLYDIGNETELSFFDIDEYREFQKNPEIKWES